MSLDHFPRVSLMFGPSPVHPLPRLSAALGGKVEIWAKREDCNSGIAFGGNFDTVIVCTVTGSTHAGMIAGTALEGRGDRRVIGIDASKTLEKTVDQVGRIARFTAEAIGVDREIRTDEITLVDGYAGPAYAISDEQTIEAIHLAARTEGMLTDPVYEGKSMAGPIGMIRSGEIPPGSRVLYAHLGGQPALSAYAHTPGLGG